MFTVATTAKAYDSFAKQYPKYADGDGWRDLKDRRYAYSDNKLLKKIYYFIEHQYQLKGGKPITILDLGCGPGNWLIRIADFCYRNKIEFRGLGIDISHEMIKEAHKNLAEYRLEYPENQIDLNFTTGNIIEGLPYEDMQFDITMCLYTVLNHIPKEVLPLTISEMMRVTKSVNITTVKGSKSLRTAFVASWDSFKFHNYDSVNEVLTLRGEGGITQLHCHLFESKELKAYFQPHANTIECSSLDLFVSLFGDEFRWRPEPILSPAIFDLEETLCGDQDFLDYANHILIIAYKNPT